MKKNLGIFLFLAIGLLASPARSAPANPDTLVENTAQEVLQIIRQDKTLQGSRARLLDLVEAKILPHFNFTRMTRLAMGKNWSRATPDQQQQLIKEFRTLLIRTYSNALTDYRDYAIKVEPLKAPADASEVIVKTKVMQDRGQQPVPIDYSMEKADDGWKVYDVTVAGISLVTNYRSTFSNQVRDGGVEKLLKTLVDKNQANESNSEAAY